MRQIRILHCNNDNKNMGGAYLVTRKLEPYVRDLGYVFDYITMDEFVINGDKDTDPMNGSRTFSAKLRGNKVLGHIELPFYVKKVLKQNPYEIVHIDIDSAWKALLYAIPAKMSGAKVLVHSHATGIDGEHKSIKGRLHYICKNVLAHYTDKYIGCSSGAMHWLCPKNQMDKAELVVNGIDNKEFFFNQEIREKCRRELGLENKFVLCNVGRINDNKNQIFLVDVLKEMKELLSETVLLLVGPYTEEDLNKLKEKIKTNQMEASVIVVGATNDVNKYLNASDYFVLPSHFEGFSLASIEAQSTGLRCLLSTGTPPEAKITDLADRSDLKLGAEEWANLIIKHCSKPYERDTVHLSSEYTMEGMAKHLTQIYDALIGG